MDNSITRRGLPCWYRHNDIGLQGINDGILLNNTIYQLTQKYFKDKPYYVHILELLHDVKIFICSYWLFFKLLNKFQLGGNENYYWPVS